MVVFRGYGATVKFMTLAPVMLMPVAVAIGPVPVSRLGRSGPRNHCDFQTEVAEPLKKRTEATAVESTGAKWTSPEYTKCPYGATPSK